MFPEVGIKLLRFKSASLAKMSLYCKSQNRRKKTRPIKSDQILSDYKKKEQNIYTCFLIDLVKQAAMMIVNRFKIFQSVHPKEIPYVVCMYTPYM